MGVHKDANLKTPKLCSKKLNSLALVSPWDHLASPRHGRRWRKSFVERRKLAVSERRRSGAKRRGWKKSEGKRQRESWKKTLGHFQDVTNYSLCYCLHIYFILLLLIGYVHIIYVFVLAFGSTILVYKVRLSFWYHCMYLVICHSGIIYHMFLVCAFFPGRTH